MNGNFQWPPLESDPEIFNEYSHKVGLEENVSFAEIYSLDYKEMQTIDSPVLAVIVSYERNVPLTREESNFRAEDYLPFYMKQTDVLDNACGLIAILHSVGNNLTQASTSNDSVLNKFFNAASNLSSGEKAKYLEQFEEFKDAHAEFSSQGQSNACQDQSDVKCHFVAFTYFQGNLVEIDGLINGPYIVKENINESELLDETIEELRKRLAHQNITDNLALMYLTKN